MKIYYPVIFIPDEGKITAIVPDINRENGGIATQGTTLMKATYWAADAIGTWFDDGDKQLENATYPTPSKASDIDLSGYPEGTIVNYVEFDSEVWKSTVNAIRKAREAAGLTIKELSNLLGAPYRTVQDWNSGARKPPLWLQNLIVEKIQSVI